LTVSELLLPVENGPSNSSLPALAATVPIFVNRMETVVVPVPTERVNVPEVPS
jgi:hypothetical protein